MPFELTFRVGASSVCLSLEEVILVGFGGRDKENVEAHIAELALHGVKPPLETPCLYMVNPALLTQRPEIAVYGGETSPEIEFVLFEVDGERFVTVGNDHYDREAERVLSVEKAKNLCMKPLAKEAWRLTELADHWDDLELELLCDGQVLQQGSVSELLRPDRLFDLIAERMGDDRDDRIIFSGTIPFVAEVPEAPYRLTVSLADPRRAKVLRHSVDVRRLDRLPHAKRLDASASRSFA